MEDWCCQALQNLKIKENRNTALQQIKVELASAPSLEARVIQRLLLSAEIYDCLHDVEQSDVAADILTICMSNLQLNQQDLPNLLKRALNSDLPHIRALALNTILNELRQLPTPAQRANVLNDDLLQYVLQALRHSATEVGAPAIDILALVLTAERIAQPHIKAALLDAMTENELVKCRIYELAVKVANSSTNGVTCVEYILDAALAELQNEDILLQVNILEILTALAEQKQGLTYLERHHVFENVAKQVENIEQYPLATLLVPGIMRFFGKIAALQPRKIMLEYPHMLQRLFHCFDAPDEQTLPAALDTLANLALSAEGKVILDTQYAAQLERAFANYAAFLRNQSSDLKKRTFNSLEVIFTSNEQPVSKEVIDILHKWFLLLNGATGSNMQFIFDFSRNPFPDIKLSSLQFVRALCHYDWGVAALKGTAGFVEYLLDRKIEFDKEVKYAKYEIIKLLEQKGDFPTQTQLQLRTFVNEGPYYVQPFMDVATEGGGGGGGGGGGADGN